MTHLETPQLVIGALQRMDTGVTVAGADLPLPMQLPRRRPPRLSFSHFR
jgi:hypothetical protein